MHKVRAAIVSGGASAYRLIASKSGKPEPRRRSSDAGGEPGLDPRLVTRGRSGLSRQEIAATLHNLRDESAPADDELAHWTAFEQPSDKPLLPKQVRPRAPDEPLPEPSLAGEIIPRRVSRTADSRSEERRTGVVQTATLTFRDADYQVRVVNTSSRGLQIECDLNAHIAEELVIRLEDGRVMPCYVRWIRGSRIGLGFREQDLAD